MMKLLVLTLLIATTATANVQEGIDIGSIIAGLNGNAIGALKSVAIPALTRQVNRIKGHIDGLLSFFKDKEGDIAIPDTPFTIHFRGERCHFSGKRLLLVDFQKCKAKATEIQTGLSSTCEKASQQEAIECATEEVLNLVKIVSIALKKKDKVTPAHITPAKTTPAPTTAAPNTQAPSKPAPTTAAPNTQAPSKPAPTTAAPNTQAPSKPAPTTAAPNTQAPSTPAPITPAPPL